MIMLQLSQSGDEADKQMRAVIFYLTTFGYIDGDFDDSEKTFVRDYIRKLVAHRVETSVDASDDALRKELTEKYTTHFHEVFESIDVQVKDLFTEAVAEGEAQNTFVHAKLKLRCFEIFKSFDAAGQEALMDTIDELIHADGQVHPAEAKFRAELADLLNEDLGVELLDEDSAPAGVRVAPRASLTPEVDNHPFFDQFEYHYSKDRQALMEQIAADQRLMDKVIGLWDGQREHGNGRLSGKQSVGEFGAGESFLDGHVYLMRPKPSETVEPTVVGDLHGCYSCLKAVLMQTNFFARVGRYQQDPENQPHPILVLLGDYIDRGMFSYQGVLRSALQLFATAPNHIRMLRGNHEYYIEHEGKVYGAVRPSEAMNTLKPHLSSEVFSHYVKLFDSMPNMLLLDRFLFVHGGIPRDLEIKKTYKDLGSLNEWDIRFQMMWSDPSSADVVPAALQEQSARFPFGRLQCQAFLQRLGCHTMVRGHEKVNDGFALTYDEPQLRLITLFSSGGEDNNDLPLDSSYRQVTPMALNITLKDGESTIVPFAIDYRSYNTPEKNAFFAKPPEIHHQAG
jgi:hypothetical protein